MGTAAAIVGAVAGIWNIWEYFEDCRGGTSPCPALHTTPTGTEGTAVLGLAVVLLLFSLATYIGPAFLFYVTATAGAAIDCLVAINHTSIAEGSFLVTLILVTASVVLSVASATRRTTVSEQSHPLNLPVFG